LCRGPFPFDHTTNPRTKRQTKQESSSQGTQKIRDMHIANCFHRIYDHAQKVQIIHFFIPLKERRTPIPPTQAYRHLNKAAEFAGEHSATIPYGKRLAIDYTKPRRILPCCKGFYIIPVTLRYIGIIEQDTNNILETFSEIRSTH
jgi:hypothetical protein